MLNCETIFECQCCSSTTTGLIDGTFLENTLDWPEWQWHRIANIDGPNAICPCCAFKPDCLDHLYGEVSPEFPFGDYYPHASIEKGKTATFASLGDEV